MKEVTTRYVGLDVHKATISIAVADAKDDLRRAMHRLAKFLLRQSIQAPPGIKPWSARHLQWLETLRVDHPTSQLVFQDYRVAVHVARERVPTGGRPRALRRTEPAVGNHPCPSSSAWRRLPFRGHHRGRGRRFPPLPECTALHVFHRADGQRASQRPVATPTQNHA